MKSSGRIDKRIEESSSLRRGKNKNQNMKGIKKMIKNTNSEDKMKPKNRRN
jgi:hypothetical protein